MMSDHSPSMGDEVFMTRKSESGKTKNVDLRETTKSGFSAFWKQALVYRFMNSIRASGIVFVWNHHLLVFFE